VPFAILAVVELLRLGLGPGYGLLPLLAIGPAFAAVVGGPAYTLSVGGTALGGEALLTYMHEPTLSAREFITLFLAIAGVTAGGALASRLRLRRERELAGVRAVADATQQVLLRPVPGQVGPVRLATRYLSASTWARVGGDLYAVVPTAQGVRLIVGDAEGKGLSAVQEAAVAMGAFRASAHLEGTLGEVVARVEATLDRELGDEQFITAVVAEVSPDGSKMEIINCGHPQPLQLSSRGPQLLGPADGSPPLGLGLPGLAERIPFTIPLRAGEPVLLYTDGLSEARNRAGEFFPLTQCASLQAPAAPRVVLERLIAEVSRYVTQQHDDMAMLLVEPAAETATAAHSEGLEPPTF
jgi:serine phosphatase RsbU (regulator of sigma subunit)